MPASHSPSEHEAHETPSPLSGSGESSLPAAPARAPAPAPANSPQDGGPQDSRPQDDRPQDDRPQDNRPQDNRPQDPAYDYCREFFTELARNGLRHVICSPGARSAPLVLSAHSAGLRVLIHHDERSGGFFALGLAKQIRGAAALICTSGSAAANYFPAVVEAYYDGAALLILTADRPPELRDRGAGQTIDQIRLYGSHVRWFAELPVQVKFLRRMPDTQLGGLSPRHPAGDPDLST